MDIGTPDSLEVRLRLTLSRCICLKPTIGLQMEQFVCDHNQINSSTGDNPEASLRHLEAFLCLWVTLK